MLRLPPNRADNNIVTTVSAFADICVMRGSCLNVGKSVRANPNCPNSVERPQEAFAIHPAAYECQYHLIGRCFHQLQGIVVIEIFVWSAGNLLPEEAHVQKGRRLLGSGPVTGIVLATEDPCRNPIAGCDRVKAHPGAE